MHEIGLKFYKYSSKTNFFLMVVFKNTFIKYSVTDVKMGIGFGRGPYHYFLVGVFFSFSKSDN